MKPKPITPFVHGIIDYAFAVALLSIPSLIKFNKKAKLLYTIDGVIVLTFSAFTKYPAGVKPIIPLPLHKIIDCASLALIAFETCSKSIKKDKRALLFSAGMVTAGVITVLLTDWKEQE